VALSRSNSRAPLIVPSDRRHAALAFRRRRVHQLAQFGTVARPLLDGPLLTALLLLVGDLLAPLARSFFERLLRIRSSSSCQAATEVGDSVARRKISLPSRRWTSGCSAVCRQHAGASSRTRRAGQVGRRQNRPRRHPHGSIPCSWQLPRSDANEALTSPASSLPMKIQFFRPTASPGSFCPCRGCCRPLSMASAVR